METINKDDYEEPRCILIDPATGVPAKKNMIPIQRIIEKLDEYQSAKDFAGAERHLKYWLEEAKSTGDLKGEFTIRNEMMGFYRKRGMEDEAILSSKEALLLIDKIGYEGSISSGTCYVNCGTVYENFGKYKEAVSFFEKAQEVYENNLDPNDTRLAGLYNNTAMDYVNLGRFGEADRLFQRALEILKVNKGTQLDQAITYLNMADAVAIEHGINKAEKKIEQYLNLAKDLFDDPEVERDGYYAFVCENCAPAYSCYGMFDYSEELEKRADDFYNKGDK